MRHTVIMESLDQRYLLASVGFDPVAIADTPGSVQRVQLQGDLLYVADSAGGLRTYSLADPANPALVSVAGAGTGINDVVVRSGLAYVAAGQQLAIYDLRGDTPVLLGTSSAVNATAYALALSGNFAYVAQGTQGLRIYDISDPSAITLVGRYDSPGTARHVVLKGSTAYLADDQYGVQIVDIFKPNLPTRVGNINTGGQAVDLDLTGNRLSVATKSAGVKIYDLTTARSPRFVALAPIAITAQATGVDAIGSTLYAATSQGIYAVDTSTTTPTLLGFLSTPLSQTQHLTATQDGLFLANGTTGFRSLEVTSTSYATLSGGVVTVNGTRGSDQLRVTVEDGILTATVNGAMRHFNASTVSSLVLRGGDGADVLDVSGAGLRSSLFGGTSNDTLRGGSLADSLSGESGNDTLVGNAGNDSLLGSDGNDSLRGGDGADTLRGDAGTDKLYGDAGNDSLIGGTGADILSGGEGNDRLIGKDSTRDTLEGGLGVDFALADLNKDILKSVENATF